MTSWVNHTHNGSKVALPLVDLNGKIGSPPALLEMCALV